MSFGWGPISLENLLAVCLIRMSGARMKGQALHTCDAR
jgi:hypothetical protein